jgi:hypothetical protein
MVLMTVAFMFALAIIAWAPDTPIGKSLRNCLIETPARIVENLTPKKIVIGAIVLVCLIGFAMSAPELAALRRLRPNLPRSSDDTEPHAGWAFA